ncbi:hypothetical protein ACN38_g12784, partial [Penicillium nordicum]
KYLNYHDTSNKVA